MTLAVILIIIGTVIIFGGFIFAAINMFHILNDEENSSERGFFKKHIVAIIIMTIGGIPFIIGVIIAIVNFLNRFI